VSSRLAAWFGACAALVRSGSALASPGDGESLDSALSLGQAPPCAVCHEGAQDGGVGAASTLFVRALFERGFAERDAASLQTAVSAMQRVDTDHDGASDIDELYWGGDPNHAEAAAPDASPPPIYGCNVSRSKRGPRDEQLALAVFALCAALASIARMQRTFRVVRERQRVTQTSHRMLLLSHQLIHIASASCRAAGTGSRSAREMSAMLEQRRFWILGVAGGLLAVSGVAAAGFSKPSDTRVTFHAVGPAGLKIEGSTNELALVEEGDNLVIVVPLGKLQTGIDVRDRHMKDKYLEVDKYPQAKLSVARTVLKLPAAGAKLAGDAPGTLTLHGQTKPTQVHYEIKNDGAGYSVDGAVHANMNDVGITVPVYLGVTVKPDVDIDVHFKINAD
jgi:polyisoprenoid-binding protein YceI